MDRTHKVNDPRDGRRGLVMIEQRNMLGRDATAWRDHTGKISVYRSSDAPKQEEWIHNLNDKSYKDYMTY